MLDAQFAKKIFDGLYFSCALQRLCKECLAKANAHLLGWCCSAQTDALVASAGYRGVKLLLAYFPLPAWFEQVKLEKGTLSVVWMYVLKLSCEISWVFEFKNAYAT
jgi:hypothetical protein